MKYSFLTCIFCLSLLGCANNSSGETSNSNATTTDEVTTAAPTTGSTYPSIPLARLEYLWENVTYMDVIFYNLPVSLNQSSRDNIRSTLAQIAESTPTINPECQSIGRIFFQVEGKNVETAEIYFQQGCTYYVWLENEMPAYANEMTEGGINFYNNIFKQVQEGTGG